MSRGVFFIFILCFLVLLEIYVFMGVKGVFPRGTIGRKIALGIDWLSIVAFLSMIIAVGFIYPRGMARTALVPDLLIMISVAFLGVKLVFALFLAVEDVYRVGKWMVERLGLLFSTESTPVSMESRRGFIGKMGLMIGAIPFAGVLYGYLKGKYDFRVERITLYFPDLPDDFEGVKIAQISDIHSGSFDDPEEVARGVKMLQDQQPDLILFTGDLVNNIAAEIEPYIPLFAGLSAPLGKYSILGNHDYGHYIRWDRKADEIRNHKEICDHHGSMGFKLLQNDGLYLKKGESQIYLAGVENWGKPPFPQYGDLDAAFKNAMGNDFTLLMSHDPTHWDERVLSHERHVHLTMSGHTHGGQLGVEIPGFRFSPSQWVYRRWAGLYSEAGQYLNVNRGFGYLGYPGRAGMPPEITLIELRKTV